MSTFQLYPTCPTTECPVCRAKLPLNNPKIKIRKKQKTHEDLTAKTTCKKCNSKIILQFYHYATKVENDTLKSLEHLDYIVDAQILINGQPIITTDIMPYLNQHQKLPIYLPATETSDNNSIIYQIASTAINNETDIHLRPIDAVTVAITHQTDYFEYIASRTDNDTTFSRYALNPITIPEIEKLFRRDMLSFELDEEFFRMSYSNDTYGITFDCNLDENDNIRYGSVEDYITNHTASEIAKLIITQFDACIEQNHPSNERTDWRDFEEWSNFRKFIDKTL